MTEFDEYERRIWAGGAAVFERTFAGLCAYPAGALLDAVKVADGCRLLDVGTGTGTVAGLAQRRGASVTAVDAEPSMVELAARNVPEAQVRHGALPDLPFPAGSFDAVVANFVLNHVGRPLTALRELRRLTRRDGRVGVTIWPQPPTPLHRLWGDAVEAAGAERPSGIVTVNPDYDFERTPEGLASLLRDAGFSDVKTSLTEWDHVADPEEWWSGPASGLATIGQVVTRQTPEMIGRIKHHYNRLHAEYLADDGLLRLPTSAILATAVTGDERVHRR